MKHKTAFLSDAEIADELKMSRSWVRKQRWLRRKGDEHVLTLDPVMIGSVPRYRTDEVEAWIDRLGGLQERADAVR